MGWTWGIFLQTFNSKNVIFYTPFFSPYPKIQWYSFSDFFIWFTYLHYFSFQADSHDSCLRKNLWEALSSPVFLFINFTNTIINLWKNFYYRTKFPTRVLKTCPILDQNGQKPDLYLICISDQNDAKSTSFGVAHNYRPSISEYHQPPPPSPEGGR